MLAKLNFDTLYNELNKRKIPGGGKINFNTSLTFGNIITGLLPFLFAIAGILLLLYLLYGGFQIMLSRGEPKGIEAGKGKITNALLGFVVIFVSFWIVQIVARILGLTTVINIFG